MRARFALGLAGLLGTTVLIADSPGRQVQAATVTAAARDACAALRDFHQPDIAVVDAGVVEAGQVHAGDNIPTAQRPQTAYCRVEARIEGNIGFLIYMPLREDWNGRMLGIGNGGDAGSFAIAGIAGAVRDGMIGITTDAGHQGNTDPLWAMSRKKYEDYADRAQHLTAVLGRDLSNAFYGKEPDRSYFSGCSGGGRQAQTEMENFPQDYDGILAGAPASSHSVQMARKQWIVLAPELQPQAALTNAQWTLVAGEVAKQCDAADGLKDGLVENPKACKFDVAKLACKAGQDPASCLAPPQIGMVNLMYGPFKDENGVVRGPPPIPGIRPLTAAPVTGVQGFGQAVHQSTTWTRRDMVIGKDIDAMNRLFPELSPENPDLTRFAKAGDKAILYQGWTDSTDMAAYTIQNYERMVAFPSNGGLKKVQDTARLFLAPISGHCSGNDGPQWQTEGQPGYSEEGDLLKLLINWVEKGQAPDRVLASQVSNGAVTRTRPLCPYPATPHYKGSGDVNEAKNFVCRAP